MAVCQIWWLEQWNPAAIRVCDPATGTQLQSRRRTLMNTTSVLRVSFLIRCINNSQSPAPSAPCSSHLPAVSSLVGVGASGVLWKRRIAAFPLSVSSPAVSQDAVGAAAALLLVSLALGRRLAKLPRLLVDAAT